MHSKVYETNLNERGWSLFHSRVSHGGTRQMEWDYIFPPSWDPVHWSRPQWMRGKLPCTFGLGNELWLLLVHMQQTAVQSTSLLGVLRNSMINFIVVSSADTSEAIESGFQLAWRRFWQTVR